MNKKVLVIGSVILGSLLIMGAGCTPNTSANKNTTNTPPVEIIVPTITIVSPVESATVASKLPLEIKVTNIALAPKEVGKANVTGHGHYHVWVDGSYYAEGTTTSMTVVDKNGHGLSSGAHTIQVSLQNNDHTDLTTPAKSAVINLTVN